MQRWKEFCEYCNRKGIPLPIFRDKGKPSVTFTLVAVSAFVVFVGLLNSFAQLVKGVDMQSALYWHFGSLAAYLGRRIGGDGKSIDIGKKEGE